MKKLLLITIYFLHLISIQAQPEPCDPDAMASTCLDACVVCDINGFTGRNNLSIQGQTFPGFCTTIFHNMSYIAFIAGTVDLELTVTVSNCTIGRGIEVGIFESLDCETFVPVTVCNTDVPSNGVATFANTTPLVIGQHYYLIMDGSMGDICNWTFNVVKGSTVVGDLESSGIITGPEEICPELPVSYSTTEEVGVTFYEWTLNGALLGGDSSAIDVTFPVDGSYELCVTASNVCDEAPPTCKTINVITPPPTVLIETICATECFDVAGESVCESGDYEFILSLPNGCDSLILLNLTVLPELSAFIEINLCIGETFAIGNTPYSTTGIFTETIPNAIGCDSMVTLDLTMIDCELIATIDPTSPLCNGDQNGSLLFSLQNGIPPFTYDWENILDTTLNGSGSLATVTSVLVENIPAGTYEINITDSFGDQIVFIQEVSQPSVLSAAIDVVDYNGFNITCFDANDGAASASGNGGLPPYSFEWSGGETQPTISGLSAGFYEVVVFDVNGCSSVDTTFLTEPELLAFSANYIDPNCDGLETGIIQLVDISGGSLPYLYALNSSEQTSDEIFEGLASGEYTFSVMDANGCIADTVGMLSAPDIPILFMDEDQEIDLGETTLISAETNTTSLIDIQWTDFSSSLECDTCLETSATPFDNTIYVLTVTSVDNCSTSDSVFVRVNKVRDVYVPNVFSPNSDNVNDYFFIQSGISVSTIKTLKIFNRWGELMYNGIDLPPNQASDGWDGSFNSQPVDDGVYVWMAEVEYLDGEVSLMSGDVTVMK